MNLIYINHTRSAVNNHAQQKSLVALASLLALTMRNTKLSAIPYHLNAGFFAQTVNCTTPA